MRVVHAHHCSATRRKMRKQFFLCLIVGGHVAVVVKMIAGEVSESGRCKLEPLNAALLDCV